jgi:hypothetical protein
LEILHDGLVKFSAGCKIPTLPEKSIWCNLYVQNASALGKRKRSIEEYLTKVYNHKNLSKNPVYQIFISDNFDNFKAENVKQMTWIERVSSMRVYLPKFLQGNTYTYNKGSRHFEKEKENLMRLDKGINEINKIIVSYLNG